MATAEQPLEGLTPRRSAPSTELADQWRVLTRAATIVAVLTSPAVFIWLKEYVGWSWFWALLGTFGIVIVFRGFADLVFRRLIPWPSLFGADSQQLRDEDVMGRRRAWYWRKKLRLALFFVGVVTTVYIVQLIKGTEGATWWGAAGDIFSGIGTILSQPTLWIQVVFVFFLFIANFGILMGPMLLMGISQIRGFEPGDAQWGVKLADVRGQAEAKEEVRRVVTLWQSGEAFERAGGKRERGLLFLGAPGTGKTMLAKALATGFNSPFVSIPGSGFAQTFIGVDAIIVRYLAWKAKRLARKWGGQCIVFIDEIDAVGMRRQALGGGNPVGGFTPVDIADHLFFGPNGAITGSGDLILETRRWRERMFETRAPERPLPSGLQTRLAGVLNFTFPGMGGTGQLALNQLLVVMDGIDNPPFSKRVFTSRLNTFLDATYIIPRRVGKVSLRLPPPGPRGDQIYFIGATNVPIERLDPALIRPGRMGRHVWFRTPTKQDRLDVFDLYITKVAHEPNLDTPQRRDEIARITNGYSPAMIDQVCSMALTIAHHDGRDQFAWGDLVEAMTTIESGTAIGIEYIAQETRAVAIHEAGHAAAGHVFMQGAESTRLSIRMRGGSLGHHQALEKEERFSRFRSRGDGSPGLDARRDGGGARLLRRELERGRRRRPVGHRPGGVDGRRVRDGAGAVRGHAARRRDRGGGPQAGAEAVRGDRRPDHEPDERRRPLHREPDRRCARRPRQAEPRGTDPRPGLRLRLQPDPGQQGRGREDRRHPRRPARDLRRRARDRPRRGGPPQARARSRGRGDMAEDVTPHTAADLPAEPLVRPLPSRSDVRRDNARRTSYRFRFGLIYIALAAIVGAGIGAFVVLASRPEPAAEAAWSSWQPEGRENAYPVEIAQHVGTRYRLPSGKQIVGVIASPATVQDLPIRAVVIQHDASNPTKQDDVEVIEVGNSVMYNLCGVGERCSIAEGKPSQERARLLRREALELALYTFKYVEDVDSVIALLPVNLGDPSTDEDDTSTALFLEKKQFRRQLGAPLDRTLKPLTGTKLGPEESQVVDTLTSPNHYLYDIQPTQDLAAIMRLVPVPTG